MLTFYCPLLTPTKINITPPIISKNFCTGKPLALMPTNPVNVTAVIIEGPMRARTALIFNAFSILSNFKNKSAAVSSIIQDKNLKDAIKNTILSFTKNT